MFTSEQGQKLAEGEIWWPRDLATGRGTKSQSGSVDSECKGRKSLAQKAYLRACLLWKLGAVCSQRLMGQIVSQGTPIRFLGWAWVRVHLPDDFWALEKHWRNPLEFGCHPREEVRRDRTLNWHCLSKKTKINKSVQCHINLSITQKSFLFHLLGRLKKE